MKKNYFTRNLSKSIITLSLIFCAFFANPALAQRNISWTGTNGNWSTASNWNYPAITLVATFATNSATITLTAVNTEIAVGDKVAGFGIPQGATITAIDAADNKKLTISANTFAAVGTPGTNVAFTFATPKAATSAPGATDIAVISNGGNPTLAAGSYFLAGLTVSNQTGPITGSTLTIPSGVEIYIETVTNESVLVKGGNIINNGYLEIKNSLSGGSNNTAGAYGMTFGLPDVLPTVLTEYTYSGSGELLIDTSLGNVNSGGILFNGINVNANLATYKLLFNGTTTFQLSALNTGGASPNANTHALRFAGANALRSCNVIIGGAGFTLGDETSGGVNGLMSIAGGGTSITIAPETTINVYSNINNPVNLIGSYIFGSAATSYLINQGTLNFKGTMPKATISLYTESNGKLEFENQGTLNIDMEIANANQGAILVVGFNFLQNPQKALVTINNKGTMNLKSKLFRAGAGHAIFVGNAGQTPSCIFNNSGTLNINSAAFSTGGRVSNISNPTITDPVGSFLNNTGIINTNQELRTWYTENSSTGNITFKSNQDHPLKLMTFTGVPALANAAIGTTYTDQNANVHTVVVNKAGTGTSLVTHVSSTAVNPPTSNAIDPTLVVLTKTGDGAGDPAITFTGWTTNNDNAFFQNTANKGVINTNTGTSLMTGINGVTTSAATSVLSPGGDNGKGKIVLGDSDNAVDKAFNLLGTLKMQVSGNTIGGVDYDFLRFPGKKAIIDISQLTLDLTGIYTPTEVTTIDIITTFDDTLVAYDDLTNQSSAIVNGGPFGSVIGLTPGWKVEYTTLPGKVQLYFDPALSTADNAFAKFNFNYYPNPTSNQLNLSAANNISKVELFNILGQKVQSNTVNATQKQLNIANLQKGVYLMEVSIDNAKQTFKIVKQ